MTAELKEQGGEIVLFGCSVALLKALSDHVPPGAITVVEEPDVVRKRGLREVLEKVPTVAALIESEYQREGCIEGLLASEPRMRKAQVVVPGS